MQEIVKSSEESTESVGGLHANDGFSPHGTVQPRRHPYEAVGRRFVGSAEGFTGDGRNDSRDAYIGSALRQTGE